MNSRSFLARTTAGLLAAWLCAISGQAAAQDTPARVLVGFPPGGSADTIARVLAEKLGPELKRTVIVDNNLCGIGVVRALLDAGLVPGRDISVIVYDGMPADTLLGGIAITAIAQPEAHAAGVQLAELMLGVVAGKPLQALQTLWQPALVPGDSYRPANTPPAKPRTARLARSG